jgi:hypothetical protein
MRLFPAVTNIKAPPALIFSVLCDIERWPQWNRAVLSVKRLDGGEFKAGSKALVRQPELPPATWQVTELEENKSFTWVTRRPGLEIIGDHFIEAGENGSKVTLCLRYTRLLSPLLGLIYRRLSQRYVAIEAEGLRQHCESLTSKPDL